MKNIIITGATSGIGLELIKLLAKRKFNLIFFARNEKKSIKLKRFLKKIYNIDAEYFISDFSDFQSVKKASESLISKKIKIDCIVNNAGKVYFSYGKTKDSIERSFQINYLSHFLLTEKLIEANLFNKNSQIINVSSVAHNPKSSINSLDAIKHKYLLGKINFKDINYEKENFKGFSSLFYSRSKMAQILWTYHQAKKNKHININAVHPGLLGSNVILENGILGKFLTPLFKLFFKSSKEGAKNIIFVMEKVIKENISGKYFKEKIITESFEYTYDNKKQKQLFEISKKILIEKNMF